MIQRYTVGNKPFSIDEDPEGDFVFYSDHEAIVKELVEVMEASEALLNDVRRRYPEIETGGFSCPFLRAIEQAIAKAREVS